MKHYFHYLLLISALVLCGCQKDTSEGGSTQEQPSYSISVSDKTLEFRSDELESKTVNITASDTAWEYEITEGSQWCKVTVSDDKQNPALAISVKENTGQQSRTAKIYVILFDVKDSVTVTQTGITPCVIPEKDLYDIDSQGGTIEVNITSNVEYEATCEATWLTVDAASDKNKTVLTVKPNADYEPRTAEVAFDFTDGTRAATVTVTQQSAAKPSIPETDDFKIDITEVTGVTSASTSPLSHMYDSDLTTVWQTPSSGTMLRPPSASRCRRHRAPTTWYITRRHPTDNSGRWIFTIPLTPESKHSSVRTTSA